MATLHRLSREQCEKAFAAYILANLPRLEPLPVETFSEGGRDYIFYPLPGNNFMTVPPDEIEDDWWEAVGFATEASFSEIVGGLTVGFWTMEKDVGTGVWSVTNFTGSSVTPAPELPDGFTFFQSAQIDPIYDLMVRVRKGKLKTDGTFELENVDEIPLPCVAVSCPRVKPHEVMGYPVCDLHVLILTSVDEANAATVAAARFGYVAELFSDDKLPTLKTAMNKPAAGPDNRVIKDFNIFGFCLAEDMGQETDRHWIDHLIFEVHCNPTDDADGDGSV